MCFLYFKYSSMANNFVSGDMWHYLGTELLYDFQNSFYDLVCQEQSLYH